ncbi:MAG: RnfH family protein [Betaproteobacteria bacterium]|nr:RnfH family protein [Betaproteobacteria bacterium]
MSDTISVEVVYALPEKQEIIPLQLPADSTLMHAVEASGLPEKYPIDLRVGKFGIFAKLAKADTVLRDRDRVEIYRPLIADPKATRVARAEKSAQKKMAGKTAEAAA